MGCGASSEKYREGGFDSGRGTPCGVPTEDAEPFAVVDPMPAHDEGLHASAPNVDSAACAARSPHPSRVASGAWQVEASPGLWETLPVDVNLALTEACHSGQVVALYSVRGARPSEDRTYDVDFRSLRQTNRKTGRAQQLRWDANATVSATGASSGVTGVTGVTGVAGAGSRTRYQWELRDGHWADFEEEEEQYIIRAWMVGQDFVRYAAWGLEYEINFPRMVQINLSTGNKRHIRVKPVMAQVEGVTRERHDRHEHEGVGVESGTYETTETNTSNPADEASAGKPRPKSQPSQPKQPTKSSKRFSLGQSGQSQRPMGTRAPEPEPRAPRSQPQQPEPEPHQRHQPQAPCDLQLPAGTSWPSLPSAREAAGVLFRELYTTRQLSTAEKKSFYKGQCLAWHPDKNLNQEAVATEVFKFLQLVRDWYLSA